ncbi:MAG: ABC transporter permease [Ardenticatenaceae bacterium]|nr:ABC transporter permease [Ardenticatenaceae bacterium]
MFFRYVWADLVRNPRRTLSTVAGVLLGVGLSCAILFFVDGLSASMTQNAVAPLPIDMQRVLSAPVAGDVQLSLEVAPAGPVALGDVVQVTMAFANQGDTPANEVVVRSIPAAGLTYVADSARRDGEPVADGAENPFASGLTQGGLNVGTVAAGTAVHLTYQVTASTTGTVSAQDFAATFSTREIVTPVTANAAEPLSLVELAEQIQALDGVIFAEPLSFADLAPGALAANQPVDGLVRIFGFDAAYTAHDGTIQIADGGQRVGEAMISAEAAHALGVGVGDMVTLALPDDSQLDLRVSGIADLTQARSLFASRRGADLETFIYVPNAVIVDSATFANLVVPAFERAATSRGDRVKTPPVREIDIGVDRELLDAEPSVALAQTQQIADAVTAVAGEQDFLLDNISNTLTVARDDAAVAKLMFVFLGVPGAILAATLAAYAGLVLAGAQRREQATLRIRGASRRHLLTMLALRVSLITAVGATVGVALGYGTAVGVIGQSTLLRAALISLVTSAVLGTVAGLLATGGALYATGRSFIDREINEEKARLWTQPPAWRRYRLDVWGMTAVAIATLIVILTKGFEGTPGSVYAGRAVELPLALLLLPIGAWVAGSLLGGRLFGWILTHVREMTAAGFSRPLALLYRMSLKRRAWSLVDVAIILGMVIALGTSLSIFTASYDGAKAADARYTVGSDLKIAPSPASEQSYRSTDASAFMVDGVAGVAPVVYGVHNVILRSNRTSEVANMAALDPMAYAQVAPLDDTHFPMGGAADNLTLIAKNPNAVLVSVDMAAFLQAEVGDTLRVLLARGSSEQTEIEMELVGLFERLPGFPDGADALMDISQYEGTIASARPAFFLVQTSDASEATLAQALAALRSQPDGNSLQIDTRLTALAKDQSSLAALNIGGLLQLDSGYSLAMGALTVAIFVFGLLLQRRREYVTLRAQGMAPATIRALIGAEALTASVAGSVVGLLVGLVMAYYLINVLRPLFVLDPPYLVPFGSLGMVVGSVLAAALVTVAGASSLVNRLRAVELLRDE